MLSRKWKGLEAQPSLLCEVAREKTSSLFPRVWDFLLRPEAIHTSEPQRDATVLWDTVSKDSAWGRDHLCSTFPDFKIRDSRRHLG